MDSADRRRLFECGRATGGVGVPDVAGARSDLGGSWPLGLDVRYFLSPIRVVLIRESLSRLFKRPRRRKIMKSLSLKQAASLLLLTFIIATARSGHAQDYKVLYRFPGPPNGKLPNAHLIGGKVKGNLSLIGTTQEGGKYCANSPTCGIVFSFSGMAGEIVIYRFTGQFDGYAASGGLAIDSQANAYGLAGGGGTGCGGFGCGTVFKIDNPSGAFSELYSFAGPP